MYLNFTVTQLKSIPDNITYLIKSYFCFIMMICLDNFCSIKIDQCIQTVVGKQIQLNKINVKYQNYLLFIDN